MLRSTRRLIATALAVLALSACTSSGASTTASGSNIRDAAAPDILKQATANAKAQTSVHIRGKGACPESAFYTDMKLNSDGSASGSVRFGTSTIQTVASGGALYLKAPETFWASQISATAATKIGDKWVRVSKANNDCLAALTSFPTLLDNYLGYGGAPVKENAAGVFGVPAIMLSLPGNVVIWVAATGEPLPVRIDDPGTATAISLGEWGTKVAVSAPTPPESIDAASLTK